MFQGAYKDTRLTLIETVLSSLPPILNMVLFAEVFSESTTQGNYEKYLY